MQSQYFRNPGLLQSATPSATSRDKRPSHALGSEPAPVTPHWASELVVSRGTPQLRLSFQLLGTEASQNHQLTPNNCKPANLAGGASPPAPEPGCRPPGPPESHLALRHSGPSTTRAFPPRVRGLGDPSAREAETRLPVPNHPTSPHP